MEIKRERREREDHFGLRISDCGFGKVEGHGAKARKARMGRSRGKFQICVRDFTVQISVFFFPDT